MRGIYQIRLPPTKTASALTTAQDAMQPALDSTLQQHKQHKQHKYLACGVKRGSRLCAHAVTTFQRNIHLAPRMTILDPSRGGLCTLVLESLLGVLYR